MAPVWRCSNETQLINLLLVSESNSEASNMSDGEADNGDVDMKPSDPNDLTAYNLDTYDEEESRGAGENDSF